MASLHKTLLIEYIVAFNIRYWLHHSEFKDTIANRVEVSTPLNSWKRVIEGVVMYGDGINPYAGDMFHETPLALVAYDYLIKNLSAYLPYIFIFIDLVTGYLLYLTAKEYMKLLLKNQEQEKSEYSNDVKEFLLTKKDVERQPLYVIAAYLFNPYILLNTVGQTTTVICNFYLAVAFLCMTKGKRVGVCLALAMATFQSLYPIVLIVPASICIGYHTLEKQQKCRSKKSKTAEINSWQKILPRALRSPNASHWICSMTATFALFTGMCLILLYVSAYVSGGWSYLNSVYGFILLVPDLRPNIGLFWYFFTEMFEHFRLLYLWAFQMNALVLYLIPLSLRTRKDPVLLAATLTAITAMFKSYPSLGDVGFYLSLLPMWAHIFPYLQQGFVVMAAFVVTSVLGPTVWHLWIYARSANANFYFGVTLAFAIAQIFLITDILFSYTRREFILRNGISHIDNDKNAKLVLQ